MKIRALKWKSHPVLGDLELRFVNESTGSAYDTIVFAGENGSGKTTIMDTLNAFLCVGPVNIFEYIEYEVEGEIYSLKYCPKDRVVYEDKYFDIYDESGKVIKGSVGPINKKIEGDVLDPRHYGSVFTRAGINYKTGKITKSASSDVDKDKHDRGDKEIANELKQLLVDLDEQYSEDLRKWYDTPAEKRPWDFGEAHEKFGKSKICRFKGAYNNFFDHIKFERVETSDKEKKVIFNKNGREISIDNLSSGEKQIVFRGAYLLRNIGGLDGGVVMIDEPEISMHPKWQKRILDYYRNLFREESSRSQKAQLFVATHSEYVVSRALEDNENTAVIILREERGEIKGGRMTDAAACLRSTTSAEVNYMAFGIASTDYHQQLYAAVQGLTGSEKVSVCDKYIDKYIEEHVSDKDKYRCESEHKETKYKTLCTLVRNQIDHPDGNNQNLNDQLALSIELMREILKDAGRKNAPGGVKE